MSTTPGSNSACFFFRGLTATPDKLTLSLKPKLLQTIEPKLTCVYRIICKFRSEKTHRQRDGDKLTLSQNQNCHNNKTKIDTL